MISIYEYYNKFSYKSLVDLIERQGLRIEKLEEESRQKERALQGRDATIQALKDEVRELRIILKYEKAKRRD